MITKGQLCDGIAQTINDLQKHRCYIDPREPVSFIGSKENETIDGNYNSAHYSNEPIKDLTIEGGYGNDTIYGSDGNDTLYGDLASALEADQQARQKTGNGTGAPGNDWLDGGAGNDVLYEGGVKRREKKSFDNFL